MGIPSFLMVETFNVYTLDSTTELNEIGEAVAPTTTNLSSKGSVIGRITPGDSLEPDVIGALKNGDIDVTSMWIGFFNIPSGFEIEVGDYIGNSSDPTRYFQVQFIDRYPGGKSGHHYEARLQTTEIMRNS